MKVLVLFFLCIRLTCFSQDFINGSFNGFPQPFAPASWTNVPMTDMHSTATAPWCATIDIVDASPLNLIVANPFHGSSLISGLSLNSGADIYHEGLMQTVNGLTVGTSYRINFRQTIVKQTNAIDTSGSWEFILDDIVLGTSLPSISHFPVGALNLNWDSRSIDFVATQTSHVIKFLTKDDDLDQMSSMINESGALRMGMDSIHLSIAPITLNVDLGQDTMICMNSVITLNPTINANSTVTSTFEWQDGSTNPTLTIHQAGIYWVDVTINNNVVDRDSIIVSNFPSTAWTLGADTSVCLNASSTYNLEAPISNSSYLWITGATNQSILISSSGDYSVQITDINGCVSYDTINVQLSNENVIANLLHSDLTGCSPLIIDFTDASIVNQGTISSVNWLCSDGFISSSSSFSHTFSTGNQFVELTATSSFGCIDDTTIYFTVNPLPIVDFNFILEADNPVSFSNHSINYSTCNWDFGDGLTSTTIHPIHQYSSFGSYTITLTCYNEFGCSSSLSKNIQLTEITNVFLPNNFTPDANEFNQTWQIVTSGAEISTFHLMLYNRWGEFIWESYDPNSIWDGTYHGTIVQSGQYNWILNYTNKSNSSVQTLKGHVNVLY